MLLSRGIFRGALGAHPPPGSVKYMLFWRGVSPPPPQKKEMQALPGKKNLDMPLLISLKLCLVLNHS